MARPPRGAPLPDGWVRPVTLEQSRPLAPTPLGTLGAPGAGAVDERGLVTVAPSAWSVDWFIGAEDGWHVPSRVPAGRVRQGLIDDTPVVETALRVPGGEILHRSFGAYAGSDGVVVVDIENGSRVPVAVAVAVRPCGLAGEGRIDRVALDETTITVDGGAAVSFARPPAFVATGTSTLGDSADGVLAATQQTLATADRDVDDPDGRASAAYVFPLAHGATLRFVLSTVGPMGAPGIDALPAPAEVARGWTAQLERSTRVTVPDERLQHAIDANRAYLVLEAARAGTAWAKAAPLVAALDAWGFGERAEDARLANPFRARLAAKAARRTPLADPDRLEALLDAATPTWRWPDGLAGSGVELLTAVRRMLVGQPGDRCLALCALVPDAWLGQGVEVHDAPTPLGRVSYAVRWHGARPALLWEVAPSLAPGATITAPGLDPSWSSDQSSGDALLAPVEPPGGLPKVYRPLPDADGAEVPETGEGFV